MLTARTQSAWNWKEKWMWIAIASLAALLAIGIVCRTAGFPQPPSSPQKAAFIVSPWQGEFCASEYLGAPPYVEVGTTVEPNTIVGRIETVYANSAADTQFLPVVAGMSGIITEVLVRDQEMVSAGQPLFKVQRAQPVLTDN